MAGTGACGVARSPSTVGLIAVFAFLLTDAANAQTSEDRVYLGISLARGTSIGSKGASLDNRRQLDLRMPLPPAFLGKTILVPSLAYETRWLGLAPKGPLANLENEDLGRHFHRIQLGLTLIRPVAPRWLLFAGAVGNLRTDFRAPVDFGQSTSWVGYALANYMIDGDPGLRLTFGLVVLWPFDVLPVIPIASFIYRKGPYILEIGVPKLTLMRKIGKGLELGITGVFDQQIFQARLPNADPTQEAHYVRDTSLRVAPTANVQLGNGNFWLSTSVGVDLLNDNALLDSHRKPLDLGDIPTRPAPYVRMSVSWRPPRVRAALTPTTPGPASTTPPGLPPGPTDADPGTR